MWYSYLFGYLFATVLGAVLIGMVVDRLWHSVGWRGPQDSTFRLSSRIPLVVGVVERVMYVTALQLGIAEFLGFWLALKVAGQWKQWGEETKIPEVVQHERRLHGRAVFQVFLVGNSLSLMYSVTGFKIVEWMNSGDFIWLTVVPALLVLGTLLLWLFVRLFIPPIQWHTHPPPRS